MTSLFILCGGLLLLGAGVSALPLRGRSTAAFTGASLGAVGFAVLGGIALFTPPADLLAMPFTPFFELAFRSDAISGFFVIVISLVGSAASAYSVGYTRNLDHQGLMGFLFNIFLLSMYAVVLSANVVTFLIAWETMAVASLFLVTFDRSEKSGRAGLVYAVMTHAGTACIIVLFLLLSARTGTMRFAEMRELSPLLPESARLAVFLLSFIGFGTKAGIMPLHTWLPKAHPAAPSNISALMSGVMIKTGVYGFIRVVLDIMGQGPAWWGTAVIIAGGVSSVLGVMHALMERDIKRLLAYSSVENVGIIFMGIGASMVFRSNGLDGLAGIALIAGLYHTLNHAVFKGLLFLVSGAVVNAVRSKNLEEMGGLLKAMPATGFCFLVGAVSICALPPFNGFVSEWLTYQSLLLGTRCPSMVSKIVSPLGGAALALSGALVSACFVKAFGISFLGMPRSLHARNATEAPRSMVAAMGVLGVLCLLLGILPGVVIEAASPAAFIITGAHGVSPSRSVLMLGETASSLSPAALLLTMAALIAGAVLFVRVVGGRRRIVAGGSWDCGIPGLTPRMQYTATAFTKPVRMIFKRIYLPKREISVVYRIKPFFVESLRYRSEITPLLDRYVYEPAVSLIYRIAGKVRMLQSGSLHLYLGYILVTLILLLVFGA